MIITQVNDYQSNQRTPTLYYFELEFFSSLTIIFTMRWCTTINNTISASLVRKKKEKIKHMNIYFDADRVLALFLPMTLKGHFEKEICF